MTTIMTSKTFSLTETCAIILLFTFMNIAGLHAQNIPDADTLSNATSQTSSADIPGKDISSTLYPWKVTPRYHGFVGLSAIVGLGWMEDCLGVKLWTSHGCQINPHLYVGGGIAALSWDAWIPCFPVFAHTRGSIGKKISAYLDAKVGYNVGWDYGFYFSPQLGCHFTFGDTRSGINVSVGYDGTLVGGYIDDMGHEQTDKTIDGGIEICLSFDF